VTNRACLARDTPALNVNFGIKVIDSLSHLKRLKYDHPRRFPTKKNIQTSIIYLNISLTFLQIDPGHRGFPSPGCIESLFCHPLLLNSDDQRLGFLRLVRVIRPGINL